MLATIVIAAAVSATVACSSSGGGDDPSVLPPVMADVSTIDGTTVQVPNGGTLDITGDDETYTDWTAEIADEDILSFTPGKDDGSATFNPGFEAKNEGTTDVEMKNSTSGDEVHFTVEVTPAK
ncbi:hypothetical protein [Agromyces sp. PvR057]|uniref:hypothetical protein n=1 Tax=Agromyces sp. PvR057 TaxID=3156403 RepID=UPI0011C074AD